MPRFIGWKVRVHLGLKQEGEALAGLSYKDSEFEAEFQLLCSVQISETHL